jgi:small subunit ribosomal protein S6
MAKTAIPRPVATPRIRKYEGLFLFGTAATSDVDGALATVRSTVEKHGGTIHVLKKWDDRKLAYEIAKQTRGLYVLSLFESDPTAIVSMERELKLGESVVRTLITNADHLSPAEVEAMEPQKPAPKPDPEDEDRPRRADYDDSPDDASQDAGDPEDAADE